MSVPEILKEIGEQIQIGATVKSVYGEPVSAGGRTVIPIARVSYGFGGGGGGGNAGDAGGGAGHGGGGGGHVSATPVGVIEIASTGVRFVPVADWRRGFAVVVLSLGIGFFVGLKGRR